MAWRKNEKNKIRDVVFVLIIMGLMLPFVLIGAAYLWFFGLIVFATAAVVTLCIIGCCVSSRWCF